MSLLFLLFTTAGAATVWWWHPAGGVVATAVYGVVLAVWLAQQKSPPSSGVVDAPYFMGFLVTLVGLARAFTELFSPTGLTNAGVHLALGLMATGVGLLVRQYLVMREEGFPQGTDQDVASETGKLVQALGEFVERVREAGTGLASSSTSLSTDVSKAQQGMLDYVKGFHAAIEAIRTEHEQAAKQANEDLRGHAREIAAAVEAATAALATSAQASSMKVNQWSDAVAGAVGEISTYAVEWQRVGAVATDAMRQISLRLDENADTLSQNLDKADNAVLRMAAVAAEVSRVGTEARTLGTALAETRETVTGLQTAAASIGMVLNEASKDLASGAHHVSAHTERLARDAETIGKATIELTELLTQAMNRYARR